MTMTIKLDIAGALRTMRIAREQLPFAAALALTRTAQAVKQAEVNAMRTSFASVNRFTLMGIYLEKATKATLRSIVGIKGKQAQWLGTEILGGQRDYALEKFLRSVNLPPRGMYAVPGPEARLVGGKVSLSWLQQVISQLTPAKGAIAQKRIRNRTLSSTGFFVLTERTGRLPPGIYARNARHLLPLIFFVSRAQYRAKYDFYGVGKATAERVWPSMMRAAAIQAMESAR
jgi:hypothetical protein